jgi:hypothetical protein
MAAAAGAARARACERNEDRAGVQASWPVEVGAPPWPEKQIGKVAGAIEAVQFGDNTRGHR